MQFVIFLCPKWSFFHCLNIPKLPKTHQTYKSHLAKNFLIYCHSEFPPLGGAVIKESAFWLITRIYFVAYSKCTHSVNFDESCGICPAHFCLHFFSTNSQNVENTSFQTPPIWFHRFARNLAYSICGSSWQKVIKRILIGQTMLNLFNNNFLQIWFKPGSVAYL